MGHARWNDADWSRYAAGLRGRSRDEIFRNRRLDPAFDPERIEMRESRDGAHNPASTPIIAAVDVTGSMGHLSELLVREGVAELMRTLLASERVTDPHLMCMGVGDAACDRAPLQVTQFEADLRVVQQLGSIWIEGGGGGNYEESYLLPWAFALAKTSCDAIEKGRTKGLLVTIGDEEPPVALLREHAERIGVGMPHDLPAAELLAMAEREWDVFHLVIEEGHAMQGERGERVRADWRALLGERAIGVADHRDMPRIIAGLAERRGGAKPQPRRGRDPLRAMSAPRRAARKVRNLLAGPSGDHPGHWR